MLSPIRNLLNGIRNALALRLPTYAPADQWRDPVIPQRPSSLAPERLPGESFEDYKVRRAQANAWSSYTVKPAPQARFHQLGDGIHPRGRNLKRKVRHAMWRAAKQDGT